MDLRLKIEKSSNGAYIVEHEVKEGNLLSKPEYKKLTFNNISELAKWIERGGW